MPHASADRSPGVPSLANPVTTGKTHCSASVETLGAAPTTAVYQTGSVKGGSPQQATPAIQAAGTLGWPAPAGVHPVRDLLRGIGKGSLTASPGGSSSTGPRRPRTWANPIRS